MKWCITDNNGIVTSCGQSPDDSSSEDFAHLGSDVHLDTPDVSIGGRFVDGVFTEKPGCPGAAYIWEPASFSWVPDLVAGRQLAKQRIDDARDAEEQGGFPAYGKVFDSDPTSVQRILGAAMAAQITGPSFSVEWTCADNSTITLTSQEVVGLPPIMAAFANALHVKARSLKDQIDAATTLDAISAIVW